MTGAAGLVIVASGMTFEAAIARGEGVFTCCGQGEILTKRLAEAPLERCSGILSFGIAAGLEPALRAGSLVVASRIAAEDECAYEPDAEWQAILATRLTTAVHGPIVGSSKPVADVAEKRQLSARHKAAALDMESHLVARFAARHSLRFAALRAVCDPADRSVPAAALSGLRADGSTDPAMVLKGLARAPTEIGPLAGLAFESARARRALVHARRLLGPGFGLVDIG